MIEAMLAHALEGFGVVMINRGVSGELAANAATRMKNEVALEQPDLVLWQVGTNDALAYVPADEFAATIKEQVDWLKAHKVDVVLVGLQFAKEMLRDAHYVEIRETLRKIAAQENVVVIRFYEAMQIIDNASGGTTGGGGGTSSSATRPVTIVWRNMWRARSRSRCSPRTCRAGRSNNAQITEVAVAIKRGQSLAPGSAFAGYDDFTEYLASVSTPGVPPGWHQW